MSGAFEDAGPVDARLASRACCDAWRWASVDLSSIRSSASSARFSSCSLRSASLVGPFVGSPEPCVGCPEPWLGWPDPWVGWPDWPALDWPEDALVGEGDRELGFDDTFLRMWHFYLEYCRAGFAAGYIDDHQLTLTKEKP